MVSGIVHEQTILFDPFEPIVHNYPNGSIFCHYLLFNQEISHSSCSEIFQNAEHFDFQSSCWTHLLSVFTFSIFLWLTDIVEILTLIAWDTFDPLTSVLLNDTFQMLIVNYGWTSSALLIFNIRIPTSELLKSEYTPVEIWETNHNTSL